MQLLKWLIRISVGFLVAVGAIAVAGVLLLMFVSRWELHNRYNRDDPNYRYVTEELGAEIDFERFNDGDWQFICVLGAYKDPVQVLAEQAAIRGISITTIDPVATLLLAWAPIVENEGAISFVDRSGRGRTVLIEGHQRLIWEDGVLCFGHEKSRLKLPVTSSSN